MNEVEKYLKKATRGLWGSKKREVREELATHIEGRVQAHRIGGLDEETAVQRTLSELGKPAQVSSGMMTLHTTPSLVGLGAVLAVAVVLTVTLISGSMAQSVLGTFYWPSQTCINALQDGRLTNNPIQDFLDQRLVDNCLSASSALWIDINTLRPILGSAGIQVRTSAVAATLIFPDDQLVSFPLGSPNVIVMDDNKPIPVEEGYFDLWELVKAVATKSSVPLSIEGWDNPTIRVDDASFQVGTEEQPFWGTEFYENYLSQVVFTINPPVFGDYSALINPRMDRLASAEGLEGATWDESRTVKTSARLNTQPTSGIYGVIGVLELDNPLIDRNKFPEDMPENDAAFYMSLAQANPDGSINLELPGHEKIRFVNKFDIRYQPGEIMLVELTASAGSWFKVVPPDQIGLER